jgi:hypothetical protein
MVDGSFGSVEQGASGASGIRRPDGVWVPARKLRHRRMWVGLMTVALPVLGVACTSGTSHHAAAATTTAAPTTQAPTTASSSTTTSTPQAPSTVVRTPTTVFDSVVFACSGSPAQVTYGSDRDPQHGSVPMRTMLPLDVQAGTYEIEATLLHGGTVTCTATVNHAKQAVADTVSTSGAQTTAKAEICQNGDFSWDVC